MNKNRQCTNNSDILFRKWLDNTREIVQDTIFHSRIHKVNSNTSLKRTFLEQDSHSHYFSNKKNKNLFRYDPVSYVCNKTFIHVLNRLKQGKYNPEIFLDLHGLTQYQSQKELAKLMVACQKERVFCVHIMHGYGEHILKKQIPFWLSQHPDVIAFHQAPKILGSGAAIVVIIKIRSC
ncbi:endonuclease SmrB [Buchnera aphidicola (Muscaphis stroyani)]|uniref:Ribosome rescue factor SmrB n=1 Tax=Buchnera aphidicola (Muscaphis stroyani) TaxID=1241869 RepID=A0A4D6Y429_9GAMM|nr:endonuclease SmrB [Buchnera aphidicola]QCI24202.1 endonuclease SmrB [Buchnera aphidicola (Muscaphis stroyani)]